MAHKGIPDGGTEPALKIWLNYTLAVYKGYIFSV